MILRVSGNQIIRKLGQNCIAGMRKVVQLLWAALCFLPRSVVRLFTVDLREVRVTPAEVQRLGAGEVNDAVVRQYHVWRRAMLWWIFVLSTINLGWQIHRSLEGLRLVDEMGLVMSAWGYLSEWIRLTAIGMLPLAAFLAFLLWRRLRRSEALILAGLIVAFLIPIGLVAVPTHLSLDWEAIRGKVRHALQEALPPESPAAAQEPGDIADDDVELTRGPFKGMRIAQAAVNIYGALLFITLIIPSLVAMFPGMLRASLRIKTLLPESLTPGWLVLSVVPLYLIFLVIVFAILSTVFRQPELVISLALFVVAPFLHLVNLRSLLRPWRTPARRKSAYSIGWLGMFLNIAAIVLLIDYMARKDFGSGGDHFYILSWIPDRRLIGYEDVTFWLVDYFGRTLLITLVVADLLLRATLSLWRQADLLAFSPEHPLRERLAAFERVTGKTSINSRAALPAATSSPPPPPPSPPLPFRPPAST